MIHERVTFQNIIFKQLKILNTVILLKLPILMYILYIIVTI